MGCRSGFLGPENISTGGPLNCRSLGYARDDKGEGGASILLCDVGGEQPVYGAVLTKSQIRAR